MVKVILHGKLGKVFKPKWDLDVKTPREALRALEANTSGEFTRYLISTMKDKNIGYKFVVDGYKIIDQADLTLMNKPLDGTNTIEVIPVIGGSGLTVILIQIAISVVLSIVSALLAPSPKVNLGTGGSGESARKESFLFSGKDATAKQGNPVPIGYGRMMVPPQTISVEYVYNNILAGAGGTTVEFSIFGAEFKLNQP